MQNRLKQLAVVIAVALNFLTAPSARAIDVTLRLVRAEQPDQLVSTAITQIDVDAEKAKAKADEEAAAAMAKLAGKTYIPKDTPVAPKAEFDRYSNYMRGIVIDKTHPFYKSYQGSYLGRSDVIKLDLPDGQHSVDPGGHVFTISGHTISTDDPNLRANGQTLDILVYPVTIIAVDGSAVRRMPAEVRRLPVAPRLYWDDEELLPKEENLSATATFKRLTLHMLANAQGAGYRLSPSELNFHVTPDGVVPVDASGKPLANSAISVEDRFTLVVPKVAIPVVVRGDGVQVLINGAAGNLKFTSTPQTAKTPPVFYMYPAAGGTQITVGKRASNEPLLLRGDLGAFPRRAIVVDATSDTTAEPRLLLAGLPGYSTDAGQTMRVRVEAQDALDATTLAPVQVAAYIAKNPVLRDDGWLGDLPAADAPASEWQELRITSTDAADLYDVVMPADLPSSVYRLRLVVDQRGHCTPSSALRADFVHGIINPAARTSVSVFSPSGRHAFANGVDVPISVVVKSSAAIPAAKLTVWLERDGNTYTLIDRDEPAREAGNHPLHLTLAGAATAALLPGDYSLIAKLGAETVSNHWTLRVTQPRYRDPFAYFDDGWGGTSNLDAGSTYSNVPSSVAEANAQRRLLQRNAEVLGRQGNLNFTNWSVHRRLSIYQGRDSSSEIAQVETILRDNPSLPAAEVYYYQNHFEATCEALAMQGMGELQGLLDSFSPRSLAHSVVPELNSKMRQYQLTAQSIKKFDNFMGFALVKDDTAPTGDSEVGDNGRSVRLVQQLKNFVAKHGFGTGSGSDAAAFLRAYRAGNVTPELAQQAKQWEAWAEDENSLLGDFYGMGRAAVDPIWPGLLYPIQGPGWGGTWVGGYPVTAHKNQSPLTVQAGTGDYTMMLILDPLIRTRFFGMTEGEKWGVLGVGVSPGFYNLKSHFAGYLSAGALGMGYYNGQKQEASDPGKFSNLGVQEERQDLHDLIQAYGPMFREMRPTSEIAILYPFHQTAYEVLNVDMGNGRMVNAKNAAYSAIGQLAMSGHGSEMLSEEMIAAGELKRFKVVIAPALYYLHDEHLKALEKFAADGGLILCGSRSTLIPKGAKQIDDDFVECAEADDIWSFNKLLDIGHAWVLGEMRRKAPILRVAVDQAIQPFARPSTDRVIVQTSRAGAGRYTIVSNNLFPSFMGTQRVSGNSEWSSGQGEANESTLVPIKETVYFPSDMTTYELYSQKPIVESEHSKTPEGRTPTEVDLSFTPFRIFISLPKPIASLKIEAPAGVTLGTHFPVRVTPLDEAGEPIDGSVPLHLSVTDETGAMLWEQSGASMPTFAGDLAAPLGRKPGKWTITVKELISGRVAKVTMDVAAPQSLPFGASIVELPAVDVQRPDLVRDFIEGRKKDGENVLVILGESQGDQRPLAEEIVAALKSLGVKAEIKTTNDAGVFTAGERVHLYQNWEELNPAQYIDHPIVLLGGEGQSALLEEVQENQLIGRPLTANYPGPGRGVLTVVRSPFAYNRDVLCVLGPDATGVRAAVAELSKVAASGQSDASGARGVANGNVQLASQTIAGELQPGTPFSTMDGEPVQVVTTTPDGKRIAFGALGYAKNVFVFDAAGKLQFEDKIGHVNTQGLSLSPETGETIVNSDFTTYLRAADGTVKWRLRDVIYADNQARYFVLKAGRGFAVYDPNFKLLWQFDDWDSYQTTKEILFAREAKFMATFDDGKTIAYRLTGKSPGLQGEFVDDLVFCDAITGVEKRRASLHMNAIIEAAGLPPAPQTTMEGFRINSDGSLVSLDFESRELNLTVLLDANLQPIQRERFDIPPYLAKITAKTNQFLSPDKRQIFTVGDTLCISDVTWTMLKSTRTDNLILSMVVDATRQRILVSNYSGIVTAYDFDLKQLWQTPIGSAAKLALLPDGSVAAGTVRGDAILLDVSGKSLWKNSLNRYAPPEEVEARWAQLEALPSLVRPGSEPWWQQIEQNLGYLPDIANLAGTAKAAAPVSADVDGKPFGTYLVEWRHQRTGNGSDVTLSLDVTEDENAVGDAPPTTTRRINLSARPQASESTERALLRLGDRPAKVHVLVRAAGSGEATTAVSIRPLAFPTEDLIRIPSLYRDSISENVRANPPVTVDLFQNVAEEGEPHITRWADPYAFVNGRMLEKEPRLLDGKWFGSGNFFMMDNFMEVPCWIDLTLPNKRIISHIVIAEDPSLPHADTISVDAYVESRENRKGLTEFEKRQLSRGFWYNVVKVRGNTNNYNVYQFNKPVYTRHLRVYVLGGHASIGEIELYGAVPKVATTAPTTQPAEKTGEE